MPRENPHISERDRLKILNISALIIQRLREEKTVTGSFKKTFAIGKCRWIIDFMRTTEGDALVEVVCDGVYYSHMYTHPSSTTKSGLFASVSVGWREVVGSLPAFTKEVSREFPFIVFKLA